GASTSTTKNDVRVVRAPGGLRLPPLTRTITDPQTMSRLATDVRSLPVLPAGEHCPADLGTVYALTLCSRWPHGPPRFTYRGARRFSSAQGRHYGQSGLRPCGAIWHRLWGYPGPRCTPSSV